MVAPEASASSSHNAGRAGVKPPIEPEPDPAAAPEPASTSASKSIILFSDGTGNSSAKLFKTNVWRLYEALDLGPPTPERSNAQIAYYDNGVGTSQFRPLALLGGILGIGLKRNMLAIYRFLCRNYQQDDKIYVFGFSRGAFTIRLLMGLIAQEGIVEYQDEKQLAYHSRDAYRAFCRSQWPNRWPAKMFAIFLRAARDLLLGAKRALFRQTPYSSVRKYPADIEFAGLWDTVAAYGGPSVEITRGIDDWIWPLTMANYELSPKVRKARHALCLDDRRDAFQPLLFDEVREKDLVEHGRDVITRLARDGSPIVEKVKPAKDRLVQVWFAGMHADVGGGYPDETLSYVSLAWIIGETDLALLPMHKERIETMANDYGPVHNSRAGLASYYRYQPRKLEAMMHPLRPHSWTNRILRDPELKRDGFPDHGLLTEVKVHKSVLTRIRTGTDGYAPINLPENYVIYPSDPSVQPKGGSGQPQSATRPGTNLAWARVWDLVWWRRVFYFLTTLITLALFTMPLWGSHAPALRICEDARCWARSGFGLLDYVLPGFARTWTSAFSAHFSVTLVLLGSILLCWLVGARLEDGIADRARAIWRGTPHPAPRRRSPVQVMRESKAYQYFGFAVKWYALPLIAAMLTVAALLIGLLTIAAQTRLYVAEQGMNGVAPLCPPQAEQPLPARPFVERRFDIRGMCTPLGLRVEQGKHYVVHIRVVEPWTDGGHPIAPDGTGEGLPFYVAPFEGMRRVVTQPWLQPLIAIRPPAGSESGSVYIDALQVDHPERAGRQDVYTARFAAARNGNLSIFVNDAVLPFSFSRLYDNNAGVACISVIEEEGGTINLPRGNACGQEVKDLSADTPPAPAP
jgi:uncharacterized protein (DUF2235 family)